jgi:glycosyltransferase involved in cell wall biosynthesis
MKRVVMIAYFFPPEGSAGSYRPLRFVRQLPKYGWSPVVVTNDPYSYERHDPKLLDEVPAETEIIRVRSRDVWQAFQAWRQGRMVQHPSTACTQSAQQMRPAHSTQLRTRIRRAVRFMETCYYRPDLAKPWIQPAIEVTLEVCRRIRPSVIWATAGPVSSWVVAKEVARRTGIPYVLDLRDPWGLSYHEWDLRTPPWVGRQMRETIRDSFSGARSVVLLFDSVAQAYSLAIPGALDAEKIHIIPNGYDGTIDEFTPPDDGKCTVLYTGTIVGYRYDTLLDALLTFKETEPRQAAVLRFRFVGEGMGEMARAATERGLADIVETAGPTSQNETMRLQRAAHALLVLGRQSTIAGHELFAPAKVFGYLRARRPVLGILPNDETRKVLTRVGVSSIADVESTTAVARLLRELVHAWSTGTLSSQLPDVTKCELYSAERQTEALVCALEGSPAIEPFIPGSVEIAPSLRERLADYIN